MAVCLRKPVVLCPPPDAESGLSNPGVVVRLTHNGQLERAGIVTGEQAGRDTQPGICLAVIHIPLFPVPLRSGFHGQNFVNGPVTLPRKNEGLGRIQPLADHRGQIVEVGQVVMASYSFSVAWN